MILRKTVLTACIASGLLWGAVAAAQPQPRTLEELQRFYPPVEDRVNAALVYQKAVDARVLIEDEYDEETPILAGRKPLPLPAEPLSPKAKGVLVKVLEANTTTLQLLHEAAAMTQCRFPADLTKGPAVELPYLARMRDLARLLAAQALNAADDGKAELAVQSLLDGMALAQSLRKEPLIISQLVRVALWAIAVDALEQVVNRVPLNERLLLQLQAALVKADDREAVTRAFQGELCSIMSLETETPEERAAREEAMEAYQEQMRAQMEKEAEEAEEAESRAPDSTDEPAAVEGGDPANGPAAEPNEHTAPPSPDPEMLRPKLDAKTKQEMVQGAKRTVDESRLPYVQIAKLFPAPDPGAVTPGVDHAGNRNDGRMMPALGRTLVAAARLAAKAAAAQGAMAVERYRLKNGTLPEQWNALVPDILAREILDPFTQDSTIMLRTTDAGYLVYSIGENGIDDGGISEEGRSQLDYVFRVMRDAKERM